MLPLQQQMQQKELQHQHSQANSSPQNTSPNGTQSISFQAVTQDPVAPWLGIWVATTEAVGESQALEESLGRQLLDVLLQSCFGDSAEIQGATYIYIKQAVAWN